MNKTINIFGGGTVNYVRSHLAIAAPSYGSTARTLGILCKEYMPDMDVAMHLTRMADHNSFMETSNDVLLRAIQVRDEPTSKVIFFTTAVADFEGQINGISSGKFAQRMQSRAGRAIMDLTPSSKIIGTFRKGDTGRKDLFLVGFKATTGASPKEQYIAGLNMLKESSANLVFANDAITLNNMIICPEESVYAETMNRHDALAELIYMTKMRSHLTFTRSTVIDSTPINWKSLLVPDSLRTVVDWCIEQGAYRKFRGVTAGHFAVKIDNKNFLTSRRKQDFNDLENVGLVLVTTDSPDSVIAYGSKPSVGGQSQRIVFADHPDEDCVVHFHCPLLPGSNVPTVSQKEFECGSHECGRNTSQGLKKFGNLKAVYLDNHGPNIVFNRSTDPVEVIRFIDDNFDLTAKSGGYEVA